MRVYLLDDLTLPPGKISEPGSGAEGEDNCPLFLSDITPGGAGHSVEGKGS